MSELVERLREAAAFRRENYGGLSGADQIFDLAADRITFLERELARFVPFTIEDRTYGVDGNETSLKANTFYRLVADAEATGA